MRTKELIMNGRKRRFETTDEPVGMVGRAQAQVSEAGRRARDMVDQHPTSTTFLAFGAGLAAGLAVVALLHQRRSSAWYEEYLPSWMPTSQLRQVLNDAFACHR
jgi:hypothetical protein